jgi:hypothetical protein
VIKIKSIVRLILISTLMVAGAPAYSSTAMQMWACEIEDGATEQEILEGHAKWLKAAKKLNGGEQLEAYVYFPIAVNATGETDLMLTIIAPSFEAWGKFWDAYEGSEAAKLENENSEHIICPNSAVWESFKMN